MATIPPTARRTRRTGAVDLNAVLGLGGEPVSAPAAGLPAGELPRLDGQACVVARGVVLREQHAGPRVTADLLGPGDVFSHDAVAGEAIRERFRLLVPAVLVVVAHSGTGTTATDAALLRALERQSLRALAQRLATCEAQLEGRIRLLLPDLADRFGVMGADGVLLPAYLRHSVLAALLGVRRPSFTTAAHRLAADGTMSRMPDGRWLVDPGSCFEPAPLAA